MPIAGAGGVVPSKCAKWERTSQYISTPAEVCEIHPAGVAVGEDKITAAEMPGHGVVPAIRFREIVFGLLTEEECVSRDGRLITSETDFSGALLMPLGTYCVHEAWIGDCGSGSDIR